MGLSLSGSSFPEGTLVLTPEGKRKIEDLREGDLVIARNEETGQTGVFPVTAVMGRQATDLVRLTLEGPDGTVSAMAVTAEHPLYVAGEWVRAGDLKPGDGIENADETLIRVLTVTLDATPTLVHNIEVAGAHTYFAGELEAWAHNAGASKIPTVPRSQRDPKRCADSALSSTILGRDPTCVYCGAASDVVDHFVSHSHGGATDEVNLRGCCKSCNLSKSNLSPMEWFKKLIARRR
nr:polymorphic toxin-type HINT domain-containing protein [Frigidibacter sp. SD6-1]